MCPMCAYCIHIIIRITNLKLLALLANNQLANLYTNNNNLATGCNFLFCYNISLENTPSVSFRNADETDVIVSWQVSNFECILLLLSLRLLPKKSNIY